MSQSLWMETMHLDIEGSAAAADQSQQVISSQPEGLRIVLRNETPMPGCDRLCMLRYLSLCANIYSGQTGTETLKVETPQWKKSHAFIYFICVTSKPAEQFH